MLSYKDFLLWLDRGAMNSVAGLSGHFLKCPVSLWLSEVYGGVWSTGSGIGADMSASKIEPHGCERSADAFIALDGVLTQFVREIDGLGQRGNGGLWSDAGDFYQVTFGQCKRVLSNIITEVEAE